MCKLFLDKRRGSYTKITAILLVILLQMMSNSHIISTFLCSSWLIIVWTQIWISGATQPFRYQRVHQTRFLGQSVKILFCGSWKYVLWFCPHGLYNEHRGSCKGPELFVLGFLNTIMCYSGFLHVHIIRTVPSCTAIPNERSLWYTKYLHEKRKWKTHIKDKLCQLKLKLKNMSWLINTRSQLSLDSKLTVYKTILQPIWTYGIELWGCSKPSNTKILQTFQSKMLRMISSAPWYVSNQTLHNDFEIRT